MTKTSSSPNTKTPTIHDVAAALGLHKSTISLAFSGKGNLSSATRRKILDMAQELGYEPNPLAQRLAKGMGNNLVCLCSGALDVGLMTQKILLIQEELTRRGMEVPIYTVPEQMPPKMDRGRERDTSQAAQVRQICRQQPRAIVCAAQMLDEAALRPLEIYRQEGGIVISYDVAVPLGCDQVVFDREDNAYRAARHLIEQGHRHIGIGMSYTNQESLLQGNATQNLRLQGFRRALEEAGLEVRDEWIFQNPTYEKGGLDMARHFLAARQRPTGLCIVNDYVAFAFMVEVMRAGLRVPDDISLVGHDNQPVAALCPVPLSSTTQPVDEIAHAVVELLLERLGGSQEPPRTITIQSDFVPRQSVAPLNSESA